MDCAHCKLKITNIPTMLCVTKKEILIQREFPLCLPLLTSLPPVHGGASPGEGGGPAHQVVRADEQEEVKGRDWARRL